MNKDNEKHRRINCQVNSDKHCLEKCELGAFIENTKHWTGLNYEKTPPCLLEHRLDTGKISYDG